MLLLAFAQVGRDGAQIVAKALGVLPADAPYFFDDRIGVHVEPSSHHTRVSWDTSSCQRRTRASLVGSRCVSAILSLKARILGSVAAVSRMNWAYEENSLFLAS